MEDLAAIADRVNAGESWRSIGRERGCDPKALAERVRRAGLTVPIGAHRASKMRLPTAPTDLAYMAGIIDGEGSISSWTPRSQAIPKFRVEVVNTSEALIEWLSAFGGNVYAREYVDGRQIVFVWEVNALRDIQTVLVAVEPYLLIKRRKAQDVLAQLAERLR